MASIRARLTTTYAAALAGTMLVFGATLWIGRGASVQRQLERYASAQAEVALRLTAFVRRKARPGEPVQLTEVRDTVVGPTVVPELYTLLEALPEFILVVDANGQIVYGSREARLLSSDALDAIRSSAPRLSPSTVGHADIDRDTLDPRRRRAWEARGLPRTDQLLIVRRNADTTLAPIGYVIAGTSVGPSHRAQTELLGSMLAVAPFVLLVSIAVAYYLAGNTLRPLEQM